MLIVYNEVLIVDATNPTTTLSVRVSSDRNEYTLNQYGLIYIKLGTLNNSPIKIILEDKDKNGNLLYKSSLISNKYDNIQPLIPTQQGLHNVTVTAIQNGISDAAVTYFNVISIYDTSTAKFLYLGVGFFIGLIVLVSLNRINRTLEEILRFLCLSGIVMSVLLALLFTNAEFGEFASVGLVKLKGDDISNGWVINVGGSRTTISIDKYVYDGGLQIPVYVVIFGLLGGYIRYLYKTSRLYIDDEFRKENAKIRDNLSPEGLQSSDINRQVIFYQSLKDIMLFFLSPLLAIVVWFLFNQWEPVSDAPEVLAVFSFAAGLTTTEIINAVGSITKNNLSRRTSETPSPSTTPVPT
jgi:hypothetical protein